MTDLVPIREFIVVEGRADTQNLSRAVIADTIETGGSALDAVTLDRIAQAVKTRGAIILTDPDFNGLRLRQKILAAVPGCLEAFISQDQGRAARDNPHKSLGVEHASPAVIQAALAAVVHPSSAGVTSDIDRDFLLETGLLGGPAASAKRQLVGEQLHLGYSNGKQFYRRLRAYGYQQADVLAALKGK
ncbi:ribonuclease M5 [Lactobacillaceae bacterium L1_55_11]|nr:ribonuclease M5 [Lactobacillaceae bacterium L1_55_11]